MHISPTSTLPPDCRTMGWPAVCRAPNPIWRQRFSCAPWTKSVRKSHSHTSGLWSVDCWHVHQLDCGEYFDAELTVASSCNTVDSTSTASYACRSPISAFANLHRTPIEFVFDRSWLQLRGRLVVAGRRCVRDARRHPAIHCAGVNAAGDCKKHADRSAALSARLECGVCGRCATGEWSSMDYSILN